MKKQNKFKHTDFKYEPIRQKKQPFWMHSVDRPVSDNEIADIVKAFAMLLGMGVLMLIAFCIVGGGQ